MLSVDKLSTIADSFLDVKGPCTCAPAVVTKYQKWISSPLLYRTDIHISVPKVLGLSLMREEKPESADDAVQPASSH